MQIKPLLLILIIISSIQTQTIKTLQKGCLCDISSSCDNKCCCDGSCSNGMTSQWQQYNLCDDDSLSIPICTDQYSQIHKHDLYSGVRIIYTIIKRLFCISRINFVNPADQVTITYEDTDFAQNVQLNSVSSVNPFINALSQITTWPKLPLRDGAGVCQATTAIRDMNNLKQNCLVQTNSGSLATNPLLSVSQFISDNSITNLKVFTLSSASSSSTTSNSSAVTTSCSGTACSNVIKMMKLFIIKSGSSYSLATDSYVVVGDSEVAATNSYLNLQYDYQFMSSASSFKREGYIGYSNGSSLVLLNSVDNAGTIEYSKIFNPVNLAFIAADGSCRTATSDTADAANLIDIKFGQNAQISCTGGSSLLFTNLNAAFNYVGKVGSSSTTLSDYVSVQFPTTTNNNKNIQIVFLYTAIGMFTNPQYQILKAKVNEITTTPTNGQLSLFIEFQQISNSAQTFIPSPPTINTYLPDDFLYPFSS